MDLVAPIRVVVVDDKPTHLFSIVNGLTLAGIPCVWHLYDVEKHQLIPKPPEGGYPHLRMLVTDLNIREMAEANRDAKTLAGVLISEVLRPLVAKDGGPYSIVLWTNVDEHAKEVGPLIETRIGAEQLPADDQRPAPLHVSELAKGPFLSGGGNEELEGSLLKMLNNTVQKADEFRDAVRSAVSADPRLRLVSAWESRVGVAAASTMKSIHSIAVAEAVAGGKKPATALETVLAKITVEAVGEKNAVEDPTVGLDAGLLDLVVDELGSNSHAHDYATIVEETLVGAIKAAPTVAPDTRSRLNTHLHIEVSPSAREVVTRGAVFEVGNDVLKELCGQEVKQLLDTEFLPKASPSVELQNEARIRLIEIGADCDHAQRKPRTIRLLLAAELPVERLSASQQKDARKLEQHDALSVLGPWKFDKRDCVLLVSLRRFVTIQEWACPESLKMLYRVRKPIADLLLYKYTTYSNRPGIVAITG
jgi:hypothetical protein